MIVITCESWGLLNIEFDNAYLSSVGDEYSAMFLLQHGASSTIRWPQTGEGPLHLVCRAKGLYEVGRKLLQSGADPNAQNDDGM